MDANRLDSNIRDSGQKSGLRYWINLLVFTLFAVFLGFLFIFYIGYPYFISDRWAHPRSPDVCCETPADRGLLYENVSFDTRDGVKLRGWFIPSQNRAMIILTHGLGCNRTSVLTTAEMFARNGYGVLMFDLRAHGDSGGDVLPFGGDEAEDIRGAVDYLRTRNDVDPDRIGAMGISLGGQVSILGAALSEDVKAVAADGPCCTDFSDIPKPQNLNDWMYLLYYRVFFTMLQWRTGVTEPVSLQEALAEISPRPVLLIGGGSEQARLSHLFEAALEPKELWIIPEAGHTGGIVARPEEYEKKVIDFFDQALSTKPDGQ